MRRVAHSAAARMGTLRSSDIGEAGFENVYENLRSRAAAVAVPMNSRRFIID